MRFLGIDYGLKRIGISISDEGGTLAFPKEIIPNNESTLKRVGKILKEENISEIVIGESLNFEGKENKIMTELRGFASEVKREFGISVNMEKEFLTSVEARRYDNTNEPTRHTKKNN